MSLPSLRYLVQFLASPKLSKLVAACWYLMIFNTEPWPTGMNYSLQLHPHHITHCEYVAYEYVVKMTLNPKQPNSQISWQTPIVCRYIFFILFLKQHLLPRLLQLFCYSMVFAKHA